MKYHIHIEDLVDSHCLSNKNDDPEQHTQLCKTPYNWLVILDVGFGLELHMTPGSVSS